MLSRSLALSFPYWLERRPELGPRGLGLATGFGVAGLAAAFLGRVAFEAGALSIGAADFGTRSTAAELTGRVATRSDAGRDLNQAGSISVESIRTWW